MTIAVALWSLCVPPGKPVLFEPESDLRITNVALGEKLADPSSRTSVKLTYNTPIKLTNGDDNDDDDDKSPFTTTILCSLTPGKIEQATIDLIIEENEELRFEVVGKNTVYLTGNYIDQVPPPMPFDDESDEDEDEEAYDLREVSSDVEVDADEFGSDADRFEEVTDVKEKMDSLKRPRDSDAMEVEGDDKKLSKAEKKRLKKKLKAEGGQAVAPDIQKKANEEGTKDKKKEKHKDDKDAKDTVKTAEKKEKHKDGKGGKDTLKAGEKKDGPAKDKEITGGIKIKDVEVGAGPQAKKGNTVSMRYVGKLQDGKVFDKNVKGSPFTFHLGRGEVIKGWDEGIVGMQVGGKRILTIPPNMGYGGKHTSDIPANSTLIFECKLLEIK